MADQAPTPWANILKSQPSHQPSSLHPSLPNHDLFNTSKSTKGISVAVVDANAIIHGGEKLNHIADKFVSITEVIDEVRDPVSRHRLNFLPFNVDTMEPSPESLRKVINFARATGDLQTLSDVDIKLIALTYTLEAQVHGTGHLRDCPPSISVVNVKRLPEKDMPGWGSNVPNLEEWEALEHETEDGAVAPDSKILPLKDLNLNTMSVDNHVGPGDGVVENVNGSEVQGEGPEDPDQVSWKPRKYLPKKKDVKLEGKLVADGVDASQGQCDDNASDWLPAVSRSTHRRFLRRKARRELSEASSVKDADHGMEENLESEVSESAKCSNESLHEVSVGAHAVNGNQVEKINEGSVDDENISSILKQMRLKEESLENEKYPTECSPISDHSESKGRAGAEEDEVEEADDDSKNLEISSEMDETADASYMDDNSSEQSWMLRSLSDSSIACITSDFAMQNVLLQMGLRLLAPGGMQIRQLHRWVLKCHACFEVTAEIGRIFCPKCGNGGTLRKVAVTVSENGIVLADRKPRVTLRGTKFSIPLPQGGRDAITKNPILREDQLPQKLLYPKTRKKANKEGDDLFLSDDIFHHTNKKAPLKPPVGRAVQSFTGKRNPNDNHYSRSRH